MLVRTMSFVETVAGVTYTARTSVPAGARIIDVLLETTVAWTAATAPIDVGDSDAVNALISGTAVSPDDLAAQQGITASTNESGTDWGNGLTGTDGPYSTGGPGKLYPSGDIIEAVITPTVPGGPTGVSRVTILFVLAGARRSAIVA